MEDQETKEPEKFYIYVKKNTGVVKYLKQKLGILNHVPVTNIEVPEEFEIGSEDGYIFKLNTPLTENEINSIGLTKTVIEIVDGEEVPKEVPTKGLIKTLEDGVFIPYVSRDSILKKLKDSDNGMCRIMEELVLNQINEGKEFHPSILDKIARKQNLRLQLNEIEE